jgi:hypothetical protein
MVGSCEHGNKPSTFIIIGEILIYLTDDQRIKRISVLWNWLLIEKVHDSKYL